MSSPDITPGSPIGPYVSPAEQVFDRSPNWDDGIIALTVPYAEAAAFVHDRLPLNIRHSRLVGTEVPMPMVPGQAPPAHEIVAQFIPELPAAEGLPPEADAAEVTVHGVTVVLHKRGIRRRPADHATVYVNMLADISAVLGAPIEQPESLPDQYSA